MRRKILRIVGLLIVAGLVVIQFFRPELNSGDESGESDMIVYLGITGEVADVLKSSCYDCHSNRTDYPWYNRVAPVSWYLGHHISEAKGELNFSEFGDLRKSAQLGALSDISDVVGNGSMPLKSYLLIHREARLDEATRETIVDWTADQMEVLLKK